MATPAPSRKRKTATTTTPAASKKAEPRSVATLVDEDDDVEMAPATPAATPATETKAVANGQSSSFSIEKDPTFVSVPFPADVVAVSQEEVVKKRNQIWLFRFPQEFDVQAFSKLTLKLPAMPKPGSQIARFSLGDATFSIIEAPSTDVTEILPIFPEAESKGTLSIGKPISRTFTVCHDKEVLFPTSLEAVVKKSHIPDPLKVIARATKQTDYVRFKPLGFVASKSAISHQVHNLPNVGCGPATPRISPDDVWGIKKKSKKQKTADPVVAAAAALTPAKHHKTPKPAKTPEQLAAEAALRKEDKKAAKKAKQEAKAKKKADKKARKLAKRQSGTAEAEADDDGEEAEEAQSDSE